MSNRERFNLLERPWMLFSRWHWKYSRQYWLKDLSFPLKKVSCFFGFHEWDTDDHITNGCLWRFCKHCGLRQRGQYDMMYGCTDWENF